MNQYSATEQPDPLKNDKPAVWELVMKDLDLWGPSILQDILDDDLEGLSKDLYGFLLTATIYKRFVIYKRDTPLAEQNLGDVLAVVRKDMEDRDNWGRSKYKVPLQPFNGRDVSVDLYQELLDAVVYQKQEVFEQENNEN